MFHSPAGVDVHKEHDLGTYCNLQHSLQPTCQVAVTLQLLHGLGGLLVPLECAFCLVDLNSSNLPTTGVDITLSLRACTVFWDGHPRRISSGIELNTWSFFWRPSMVNLS